MKDVISANFLTLVDAAVKELVIHLTILLNSRCPS